MVWMQQVKHSETVYIWNIFALDATDYYYFPQCTTDVEEKGYVVLQTLETDHNYIIVILYYVWNNLLVLMLISVNFVLEGKSHNKRMVHD